MITILIRRFSTMVLALVLLLGTVAGCDGPEGDQSPSIVATTSIWGDVVSQILGSEVEILIPPGADAHEYRPSSAQIARLLEADLIVANGLGLEHELGEVLDTAVLEGVEVLFVAEHLDPIQLEGADGTLDPHVWFDVERIATAAELIADALSRVHQSDAYMDRAHEYQRELEDVDLEIERLLSQVDKRLLVTNHDTLGYFAARYDLEVVGIIVPGGSSLGAPSSADLAELVAVIESLEVPAIFAETTQPTALADAVADEIGHDVQVVELHTEALQASGPADTLTGMLIENARLMAEALTTSSVP